MYSVLPDVTSISSTYKTGDIRMFQISNCSSYTSVKSLNKQLQESDSDSPK